MGAYTCEFGVVHKVCRCPTPHTIKCDKPDDHEGAEGGVWVKKDSTIHRCVKPPYDPSVSRYDVWKCGVCSTEWIVKSIGSDQRDGSTWIVWAEHESWKSGPFPPGTK